MGPAFSDSLGHLRPECTIALMAVTFALGAKDPPHSVRPCAGQRATQSGALAGSWPRMAIKGLRGMDVRRGPMHNDRGFDGFAVTGCHDYAE